MSALQIYRATPDGGTAELFSMAHDTVKSDSNSLKMLNRTVRLDMHMLGMWGAAFINSNVRDNTEARLKDVR